MRFPWTNNLKFGPLIAGRDVALTLPANPTTQRRKGDPMERRELLYTAPAAVLAARGLVRADQAGMDQIDGSPLLVGVREVSVPMSKRVDVRSLLDVGVFSAEGFTGLVLNLAGQLRGADLTGGDVGAILIPDLSPFDKAYMNMGLLPASLEISVRVSSHASPYFMAKQLRVEVGFPRYRVLLFNETNSPVSMSFFVYRTEQH